MKYQRGFTLPEMLVTLLLIGILIGMAAPLLTDSWHQVQLDCAIQQLHRDIRWAQREAQREQKKISIAFYYDRQPYRYTIRFAGNPENLRRRELHIGLELIANKRITIECDRRFDKNGNVLLKKGENERYVYYYQSGRSRITKAPTDA